MTHRTTADNKVMFTSINVAGLSQHGNVCVCVCVCVSAVWTVMSQIFVVSVLTVWRPASFRVCEVQRTAAASGTDI